MMIPTVRIFDSEERAGEAARLLVERGFPESDILFITPTPGQESTDVRSAVEEGRLPGSHARTCIASLEQGRSIVAVRAIFGRGQLAERTLDGCGPVDTDLLPAYVARNPSPLSDLLGIPTLTRGGDQPRGGRLLSSYFTLSSVFGIGLLSRNPAPLSSLFGMKLLSAPKKPWTRSLGFGLLSRNPAPLSSMLGLKLLTSRKRARSMVSVLSKDPAPLSSMLGIPVLTRSRKRDKDD